MNILDSELPIVDELFVVYLRLYIMSWSLSRPWVFKIEVRSRDKGAIIKVYQNACGSLLAFGKIGSI